VGCLRLYLDRLLAVQGGDRGQFMQYGCSSAYRKHVPGIGFGLEPDKVGVVLFDGYISVKVQFFGCFSLYRCL